MRKNPEANDHEHVKREPLARYGSAAEFDAIRDIARGDAGATKSRAPL